METELHTLLQCEALDVAREKHIVDINEIVSLVDMPGIDILKTMLTRDVLKITGRMIEDVMEKRTELLYLLEEEEEEEE